MGRDDESFLVRLRAGDDTAFEKLVRENTGRMLGVARRLLRSEEDARDAVQEAYLQAFRGLKHFEGDALLSTWLRRIVVNVSLMKLRSRRARPESSIDDLLPRFYRDGHRIDPGPPWRLPAPDPLEDRELCERVRACIDRLPDIYRVVLLLRDIEGLDTAEACKALELEPTALKMRLHRARQALRTLLDPYLREARS